MTSPVNPRLLLKQKGGKQQLFDALSASGYVPQKQPFNFMCNAIYMASPFLIEGPRGGGKTAFPEALAKALNLRIFTLPGLPDMTSDSILSSWDSAAQQHFVGMEAVKGTPLNEAMEKQWSFDFVKMGEVLDAFHYSSTTGEPCVLLIDEVDKLSQDAESAFLQILGRGFANVPRLRPDSRVGFLPEMSAVAKTLAYPIVVLTSNDMRPLSSPLRSRCRYCFLPPPTLEEMTWILSVNVPTAPGRLLSHTAKLLNGVSGLPLLEKPAVREFIELLKTFHAYGFTYLNAEMIANNVDCLAKTKKDLEAVTDAVDSLFENFVNKPDEKIDNLVRRIIEEKAKKSSNSLAQTN